MVKTVKVAVTKTVGDIQHRERLVHLSDSVMLRNV